jgi:hypothetical protein
MRVQQFIPHQRLSTEGIEVQGNASMKRAHTRGENMAKLIVGIVGIAFMLCGNAQADDGAIGLGAGTVGMETPTGIPAGTIATETPAPPSETPTQTPIPPTPTFEAILDKSACAIVDARNRSAGWWLVLLPLALTGYRLHDRRRRLRRNE